MDVLIITDPTSNWQTFGTWYSLFKNFPNNEITIVCLRDKETPFEYYQWTKRLKINFFTLTPFCDIEFINWLDIVSKMNVKELLVLRPLTMCLEDFVPKPETTIINENFWYLKDFDAKTAIEEYYLQEKELTYSSSVYCPEAKEEENFVQFCSYRKGCGKWKNTSKGCPFSSAAGHASIGMTVNENRIIELWKKMVLLYNSTN